MAVYYWVGGAGTWDNTVSNWRTTSGGATPAPNAPLATDTATFDANSGTGAVTIASTATCATCNFGGSGITATLNANHTTTFNNLNVSAGTFDCSTFNMTFNTGGVVVTGGSFLCNGGAISTASGLTSSGTTARTISLGSSTVTASATNFVNFSGTSLTFNAGTSQLSHSWPNPATFNGNGVTFNNVSFTSTVLGSVTISGANIFNNLSFAGRASVGISTVTLSADQTVNGTFTVSAPTTAGSSRYSFVSSLTTPQQRTITAAAVSLTDVDFRDIIGAGAATWTGTRLGDCGNNSGITFPAAKTVYWNLAGAQNYSATGWATTQTGTPAATNFPLPQDTAVFTNTNPAAGITITLNAGWNIGTLDFSGRANTLIFATGTVAPNIHGNLTLGSGITLSGTGSITFAGRNSTQTITSAGKTFTQAIQQYTIGGTLSFADPFITSSTYNHQSGALSTNSNLTCTTFTSSPSVPGNMYARSISLGSGQINCTGTGTVFSTSVTTNLSIIGNPTINVTSSGSTAITVLPSSTVGISDKYNLNFTGGTYALTFSSGNCNNLNFTGFSGSLVNGTRNIYGDLTLSPTMTVTAGASATTFAGTSNTQIITGNGVTCDIPISFNGAGGTFKLGSALTLGATNGNITHTNGTFDLNGYTASCLTYTTATGTKDLTFNGGSLVCAGVSTTTFNNAVATGFTTTAGTGNGSISMTGSTAKTFVGGGATYNCALNQGGTGALTITGNNTFDNITNTVKPTTVTFTSGTTNIFNNFNLSGTAGNLITINSSTAGTRATLSKTSGTVNISYCSIKDSNATGGAIWNALTSSGNVDSGNNSGWTFITAVVTSSGNFLLLF